MNLLFDFDVMNFCSRTMEEEKGGLTLLFYVVWSAFNADGWVVVGWGRDSCIGPVDILSLCS